MSSGATSSPVRPSTAASLVGLCPTTSARPPLGKSRHHSPQRATEQPGVVLDQVGVHLAHPLEAGALAGRPGSLAPPVLHHGAQPAHLGHGHVDLPCGATQDGDHPRGTRGAAADERGIRGGQSPPPQGLGLGDAAAGQLVPVVVGVPAQLHVAHGSIVSPGAGRHTRREHVGSRRLSWDPVAG